MIWGTWRFGTTGNLQNCMHVEIRTQSNEHKASNCAQCVHTAGRHTARIFYVRTGAYMECNGATQILVISLTKTLTY